VEKQDLQSHKTQTFRLILAESPFDKNPKEVDIPVGASIGDIRKHANNSVDIIVNGDFCIDDDFIPQHNDLVQVIAVPQDFGLSAWLAIISIALGAYSYTVAKKAAKQGAPEDVQFSRISGLRNEDGLYKPHQLLLGKRKVAPRYIARPFTLIEGGEEYFYALMSSGYAPQKVENFRIGDVPLSEFEHEIAVVDHYENFDLQGVRNIWKADIAQEAVNLELETEGDFLFSQSQINPERIILDYYLPSGIFGVSSQGKQRVAYTTTRVDYQEPNGDWMTLGLLREVPPNGRMTSVTGTLFFAGTTLRMFTRTNTQVNVNSSTDLAANSIVVTQPYTQVDGESYLRFRALPTTGAISLMSAAYAAGTKPDARFFGVEFSTDIQEAVPLRTRKTYPSISESERLNITSEIVWENVKTVRSLTEEQFNKGLGSRRPKLRYMENGQQVVVETFKPTVFALRLKSKGQLSGQLDNFFVDATMCVPQDKDADWRNWPTLDLEPSQNPADAYKWLLQGGMNYSPAPISKIDNIALNTWRNRCNDEGWTISALIDYEGSLQRELINVAYTGRAEFAFNDGKYTVVEKIKRTNYTQMFTPKNTRDFQSQRNYEEDVDGIRFNFDSAAVDYEKDEGIFLDPRRNPDVVGGDETRQRGRFQGLDFWGIDNFEQAYRFARFEFYEQTLQRESYTFKTSVEGLRATRGSLVKIQNDIINVGLGAGRVKSINGNIVRIDETVDIEDGVGQLALEFRADDGFISTTTATYLGDGLWECDNLHSSVNVGDLVSYGESERVTLDAIVVGVSYDEDLNATITAVNRADEIFDRDGDFIPEYSAVITPRPDNNPPPRPFISVPVVDGSRGIASVTVTSPIYLGREITVLIQAREYPTGSPPDEFFSSPNTGWEYVASGSSDQNIYKLTGLNQGSSYEIRAQFRDVSNNTLSLWSKVVYAIIPTGSPIPPITEFFHEYRKDGTYLKYTNIQHPEFDVYEIRTDTNFGDKEVGFVGETRDSEYFAGLQNSKFSYFIATKNIYGVYGQWVESEIEHPEPIILELPVFTSDGFGIILEWEDAESDFNVLHYEVRFVPPSEQDRSVENSTLLGKFDTTSAFHSTLVEGEYTYFIRAVDIAGNTSAWVSSSFTYTQPDDLELLDPIREAITNLNEELESKFPIKEQDISDEAISRQKFADGIEPVVIVNSLPTSNVGEVVFLTTDSKLYRWDGSSYIASVKTEDLDGKVLSDQIESIISSQITGQLTSEQIESILAEKISGEITETQISDNAISTPKIKANAVNADKIAANAVTAVKIQAGAVNADKIAANSITVQNAALADAVVQRAKIADLAVDTAKIADLAVTDAKIDTLSASKLTAGVINAAITNTNILTIAQDGIIRSAGKNNAGDSTAGFWMGWNDVAGAYQFGIGTNVNGILWDGSELQVAGDVIAEDNIKTNAVTANKINVSSLSAITANMGTLNAGTINVASSGNYVRLNDSTDFLIAGTNNNIVFRISKNQSESRINGSFLEGASVLGDALSEDAIDTIRNALGSAAPETGGVRSTTEIIATNTFTLNSFESNGSDVAVQLNYLGQSAIYSGPQGPTPPAPQVQVIIRRGSTQVYDQTFHGSSSAEQDFDQNLYEVQMPSISTQFNDTSAPTGTLSYSVEFIISFWDVSTYGALTSSFTFRTSQQAIGVESVTWSTLPSKPFETIGTGLSVNGTALTVTSPFNPSGTYAGLRAQATTKADVGLSGIPNTNGSTVNFLRGDGSWVTPPNTTYSAGSGISLSGTTFSVAGGDGLTQQASGLAVDSTVARNIRIPGLSRAIDHDEPWGKAIVMLFPASGSRAHNVMGTIHSQRSTGYQQISRVDFGYSSRSSDPATPDMYLEQIWGNKRRAGANEWKFCTFNYLGTEWVGMYFDGVRNTVSQAWFSGITTYSGSEFLTVLNTTQVTDLNELPVTGIATKDFKGTFGAEAVVLSTAGTATNHAVRADRTLTGGTGIDTIGNLTANRTIRLTNIAAGSSATGALFYNGTTRSAGRLYGGSTNPVSTNRLNYDGILWTTDTAGVSSKRYKKVEQVVTPEEAADNVRKLGEKGVNVGHYKKDKEKKSRRWLIAEDVAEVMKEPVYFDKKGRPDGLSYDQLIPELYAALAHALKRIDELEARLANNG